MTSGEFVCLVDDSQGDYCLSPIAYTEAMQSNEQKQWMKAMNEELESLKENETWELVNRPINAKMIQIRWVMRVKTSCDGNARFKARLVAKGYAQKQGIDYGETFSPVARYDTNRTLLEVAASKNMKLKQFDVKTAFLYGELEKKIVPRAARRFWRWQWSCMSAEAKPLRPKASTTALEQAVY